MGFLSKLLIGAVGFYAGVYVDQNYKLPSVSEPAKLLDEINKLLEEYKNDKPKVRQQCSTLRFWPLVVAETLLKRLIRFYSKVTD